MTTIAIPSELAEVLRKITGPARLVDDQGNVVGDFAPAHRIDDELSTAPGEGLQVARFHVVCFHVAARGGHG